VEIDRATRAATLAREGWRDEAASELSRAHSSELQRFATSVVDWSESAMTVLNDRRAGLVLRKFRICGDI
jgi:hypothetical protein